jgi:hypothetical protein
MPDVEPDGADERLEEAAQLLEAMAKELRKLKAKKGTDKGTPSVPSVVPSARRKSKTAPLGKDVRVRLVRQGDEYRGRTGVIVKRRGTMFWVVRLDATPTRAEKVIWRMDSSVEAIAP